MAAKRAADSKAASLLPKVKGAISATTPVAAALSFLKDTRGMTTWTTRLMAETLKINTKEAKQIIAILELQAMSRPRAKTGG
jgi:hypothetical protein